MGLLGKIALKAAEGVAVAGASHHMKKNHSTDAILEKSKMPYKLFVSDVDVSPEEDGKSIYRIKEKLKGHSGSKAFLCDKKKNVLAYVEHTRSRRKANDVCTLYANDKQIGELRRRISVKMTLESDINGYSIHGDLTSSSFTVNDDNGQIIAGIHKPYNGMFSIDDDVFIVEYCDKSDEIVMILMALSVNLIQYASDFGSIE